MEMQYKPSSQALIVEMEFQRRTLAELKLQAKLEAKTIFVIVEGAFDQDIYTETLRSMGIESMVYRVEQIDVKLQRGNKERVISAIQADEIRGMVNAIGIVDTDFDEILGTKIINDQLLYTDFSCAEAYACRLEQLEKFFRRIYGRDADLDDLNDLVDWMRKYFSLLAAKASLDIESHFPNVDKYFDKNSNNFDWQKYQKSLRSTAGVGSKFADLLKLYCELEVNTRGIDCRKIIHAENFKKAAYRFAKVKLGHGSLGLPQFERDFEIFVRMEDLAEFGMFSAISGLSQSITA
jgi:hypothetical protein